MLYHNLLQMRYQSPMQFDEFGFGIRDHFYNALTYKLLTFIVVPATTLLMKTQHSH